MYPISKILFFLDVDIKNIVSQKCYMKNGFKTIKHRVHDANLTQNPDLIFIIRNKVNLKVNYGNEHIII